MSPLDVTALVSAIITGLSVFARAELLRPSVRSAYASNPVVRILMDATALATVFVVFEIIGGAHLSNGVVGFLAVVAVTSTAMLASMFIHDGRLVVASARAADVSADASGPP